MKNLLENIIEKNRVYTKKGELASYIPELSQVNKDLLGIGIITLENEEFFAGDYETLFTIQSVSKVITLMLAILQNGQEKVFKKVGVEPTADAFNSIITLERKDSQKPLNPMINAGAIATVSLIQGHTSEEMFSKILDFTRKITGNNTININHNVYMCEKQTGDRNRALAYFMKSTGIIEKNIDEVLDVYFKQCSILANVRDLARIGAVLANDGIAPWSNEQIIPKEIARIVKTIMVTCGLYDGSGDFAVNVGFPAKSGVGGGILGSVPQKMGIGVVGPSLDERGNSIAGIKVLEDLSKELKLSIF